MVSGPRGSTALRVFLACVLTCALLAACGGDDTSDPATHVPMDGVAGLSRERALPVPLTIGGKPMTQAVVGQSYAFTPTVSGPKDATLSFSIQNKPAWASFSISTGQLSGTPGAGNVGTSTGIVISVSDGTTSATLGSFSIAVGAASGGTPGQAVLNWSAPTTNTNGAALSDLAGYTLSYGTSASELDQSVQISNPATTSYTFSNLAAGTWYFAVSAYTSAGVQSAPTPAVSLAIP